MHYLAVEATRAAVAPWISLADALRAVAGPGHLDVAPARAAATALGTWADALRRWPKPAFDVHTIDVRAADGRVTTAAVRERVVVDTPFCALRAFDLQPCAVAVQRPRVLLVAPLSGNFATLLRDTIAGLLQHADVFVTDWRCAAEVPLADGDLDLDGFVELLVSFLRRLGPGDGRGDAAHLIAVCQPGVAALAAAALLRQADDAAAPQSVALLGCPIDPRINPKVPNRLAFDRPLWWFERSLLQTVPPGRPGAGRRVYPGHLQHLAFISLKPLFHLEKHADALRAAWSGDRDAVAHHDAFYREFRATLDLPAAFYLDTIDRVFQRAELARGEMRVRGQAVDTGALASTPLLVVEGENDDITGPGQTRAALTLCGAAAAAPRRYHLQAGVGHMGLFSGHRFRAEILPELAAHLAAATAGVAT